MAGDKSEKPTPQRLKKAREQGQFLSSKGLIQAAQFIVFIVALGAWGPEWKAKIQLSMVALFEHSAGKEISPAQWIALIQNLLVDTLKPIVFIVGVVLVVGTALHLGLTQLGFSLNKLTPNFSRLNPMSTLKNLPSRNIPTLIESLAMLVILGATVYSYANDHAADMLRLPFQNVSTATAQMTASVQGLLWKAAGIFIVFGSIDLFRQYRKHIAGMKMTKEEVKEEHKRAEGDPKVKAHIRKLRRDLLRRQMMREVPKATAVIVNPTHYAVAIRYDSETMSSPVVVAKGKNWLALRIREVAVQNQVPIIENPPLARALYGALDVGKTIPPEFYKAVAEILAYIYRLMGRKLH